MYKPKLKKDVIAALYYYATDKGIKMTKAVDQILRAKLIQNPETQSQKKERR